MTYIYDLYSCYIYLFMTYSLIVSSCIHDLYSCFSTCLLICIVFVAYDL